MQNRSRRKRRNKSYSTISLKDFLLHGDYFFRFTGGLTKSNKNQKEMIFTTSSISKTNDFNFPSLNIEKIVLV